MTDEQQEKLDELHAFFMKPPAPGRKPRAQEIDEALMIVRTGRVLKGFIVGLSAIIIAVSAAYAAVKGLKFWN